VADLALLIDTNVLIWLHSNDSRIPSHVLERLTSGEEVAYVSVVSAWEYRQKRLKRPEVLKPEFHKVVSSLPYSPLDLEFEIHRYAESLPPLHNDPFDRMLIAQAIHHELEFIASDAMIHKYPVRIFW
jgi:PIN domain nuclease of toxin-antitoxin system